MSRKLSSRRSEVSRRPIFYLGRKNPCVAGGVIFYRYNQNNVSPINLMSSLNYHDDLEFLMIKMNERYEDFGGKTDSRDKSIRETIAREVYEESNGIFSRGFIHSKIKGHGMYIQGGKYLLYFIELKEKIDVKRFGTVETTEQLVRTVEWVSSNTLLSQEININGRLRKPQFFIHVKGLISCFPKSSTLISDIEFKIMD